MAPRPAPDTRGALESDSPRAIAVSPAPTPEWQFNAVQGTTHPDGARLRHVVTGAELIVRNGRLIGGAGYHDTPPGPRRELARAGAILRLRQRRRYHVHAAGVVDPSGRAWLLVGPTGSGKSTLAYALAREGWAVLGDDGVIVEIQPQGVVAMGWREPLRVSRTLAGIFPELASAHADARAIPGDARQRAELAVPAAPRATVAALVWIQQGPVDQLVPLSPTQALVDLVRESAWVLIADGGAAAHLDALRRIVTEVPSFRLIHSPAQLQTIQATLLSARP
jgi:hypothetical protein